MEEKKLSKMFPFLEKSDTNLPSTRRGGIVGRFFVIEQTV